MRKYEYKVVPVPAKSIDSRNARASGDPICYTIEMLLNQMSAEGWIYVRTDQVSLMKSGILGRTEVTRDMLIFRRQPVAAPRETIRDEEVPLALAAPTVADQIETARARTAKRPNLGDTGRARRIQMKTAETLAAE